VGRVGDAVIGARGSAVTGAEITAATGVVIEYEYVGAGRVETETVTSGSTLAELSITHGFGEVLCVH
jgi:hypothetical protein